MIVILAAAILILAIAAAIVVIGPIGRIVGSPYRSYWIPSEAMMPTLVEGDRILARMHASQDLRRGMVILMNVGEAVYIKRLAALPGDSIELIDGDVYLNGGLAPRRLIGPGPAGDQATGERITLHSERFPGENGQHQIFDSGHTAADDYPLTVIPPGRVFVLGDNRDHSADSRFTREAMGVGILPLEDVIGVAERIYWRSGDGYVNIPLAPE